MKKIGLLLIACSLSFAMMAQNTVNIFSTGAVGSFTTGNGTMAARNDNTIICTNLPPATRGYAVFDLSSIPASAVITSVDLGFNVEAYAVGGGAPSSTTRGFPGDLSLVTVPSTLYTDMSAPTSSVLYAAAYALGTGNQIVVSEATAVTFMNANIGNKVSVIWTLPTATRVYTITGETGVATTSGAHAPYLHITYNCPAITSITAAGPAAIPCPNAPFSLTGTTTGATSFAWSGPLGFSSTLANPTVASGLPSSGTYTFTATDATGCSSKATTVVTVNPAPATVISPASPTAFCVGGNCTLNATVVAGNTYQWYDGGVAIAGETNSSYTASGNGNYKVKITDVNGCTGMTAVGTPTVLLDTPSVLPGSALLLCIGDNGTITVNTNGVTSGVSFQWQKDGVDIAGSISNNYVATTSGTYRCKVSVPSTTCNVVSRDILVTVNSYPVPSISLSGSVVKTANVYAHYQWFLNTVAIPGATNYAYTTTSPGSYRVRVTDANGCSAYSSEYPVYIGTGVANIGTAPVKIYPNPVTDMLHIESAVPVTTVISSVEGRVLGNYKNQSVIDIHELPSGMYLVTLYNEAGERVVIEKITKQ